MDNQIDQDIYIKDQENVTEQQQKDDGKTFINDDFKDIIKLTKEYLDLINPYQDYTYSSNIECNYVIPSPYAKKHNYIPPPIDKYKLRFLYKLKDGKEINFDHPLPPDLPLESAVDSPHEEEEHNEEDIIIRSDIVCCRPDNPDAMEILQYLAIIILPILGPVLYYYWKDTNQKLAQKLMYATFITLVIFIFILFVVL
ncbi:hypothetical protein TVAG_331150 [Trichomonas vaginalis G3]|uniref:Uncharacterized protein n=1 Tax=Trichomonas vaginalis (strain ATCC PRA-98 / G3) TaxID=412133 RepID=A2FC34_TRIV3|nr:hypothetical protein TVAGG3_0757490 [Trichomonas vaginalis G3]EAX97529.1 hypothetical protein TVAG_331150 [Trichomonas vaginalis G3]KAI5512967.1 hypothetical protein TVAGG3_0757490 [Trichomonas vaginalis G3]|eukprot:XP_001310459.1 hypothetical protein [Trichomonas vaginalis G3]